MKKILLFLCMGILLTNVSSAKANCFLAVENNRVLKKEGVCTERYSPYSTFKIAISLIGYDSGILIDAKSPTWDYKEGYPDWLDKWKQPHNPSLWIKNSCVWYSQIITQKIGMKKFKEYVEEFNYGNKDVSGDKDKDNGLINSWLSSSLQISPKEQISFLQKLINNKLPVSDKAHKITKRILFVEDLFNGWRLYGKTGAGSKSGFTFAWFIGWIEKDNRTVVFANYLEDKNKESFELSANAKKIAKEKLIQLIQK